MRPGRAKPYTAAGIRRLPCVVPGCQAKAFSTWQACADDQVHRPICKAHDVELNRLALESMGDPDAAAKIARYEAKLA